VNSETLPNASKLVKFLPKGSSLTETTQGILDVNTIENYNNILLALSSIARKAGGIGVIFNLSTNEGEVLGTFTFIEDEIVTLGPDFSIATNISENCILNNFIPIYSSNGIVGSVKNLTSYVSKPEARQRRRQFLQQSYTQQAGMVIGGALGGLGQGIGQMAAQGFHRGNIELQNELQIKSMLAAMEQQGLLNNANYAAMEERLRLQLANEQLMQKNNQEFQMMKAGLSGASARRTGAQEPISGRGRIDENGISLFRTGKNTFPSRKEGIQEHRGILDERIDPLMGVTTHTPGMSYDDKFEETFKNNKSEKDFMNGLDYSRVRFNYLDPVPEVNLKQQYKQLKETDPELSKKKLNVNAAEFIPKPTVTETPKIPVVTPKATNPYKWTNPRIQAIDFVKGKTQPGSSDA